MQPLIPESASMPGYSNTIDYGYFAGFVDSGNLCGHPLFFWRAFINLMPQESYNCPASALPFEYEDWNPKFYNNMCRDWFKDSLNAYDKGIISDPYAMAAGVTLFGITTCMPILEQ